MRHSFATATALALLLVGLTSTSVKANPGMGVETGKEQVGIVDPIVGRVRAAISKQVSDAKYNVQIFNLPEYVLLKGDVDSEQARQRLVSVAKEASGKHVRDELRLRPALTDEQIASSVRSALKGEYPSLADRVQVDVKEGIAYLSGDLRNHREVDELLATTLMVEGVKDIRSDLTLGGRPYTTRRRVASR